MTVPRSVSTIIWDIHNLHANGVLVQREHKVTNLEKVEDGWKHHVKIISSLDEVEL